MTHRIASGAAANAATVSELQLMWNTVRTSRCAKPLWRLGLACLIMSGLVFSCSGSRVHVQRHGVNAYRQFLIFHREVITKYFQKPRDESEEMAAWFE